MTGPILTSATNWTAFKRAIISAWIMRAQPMDHAIALAWDVIDVDLQKIFRCWSSRNLHDYVQRSEHMCFTESKGLSWTNKTDRTHKAFTDSLAASIQLQRRQAHQRVRDTEHKDWPYYPTYRGKPQIRRSSLTFHWSFPFAAISASLCFAGKRGIRCNGDATTLLKQTSYASKSHCYGHTKLKSTDTPKLSRTMLQVGWSVLAYLHSVKDMTRCHNRYSILINSSGL